MKLEVESRKKSNLSQREGFKCRSISVNILWWDQSGRTRTEMFYYQEWEVVPDYHCWWQPPTKKSCKIWRHRWLYELKSNIEQHSPVHVCRICCLLVSVYGSWQLSASTAPQWRDCRGGCTSVLASQGPPSQPPSIGWKFDLGFSINRKFNWQFLGVCHRLVAIGWIYWSEEGVEMKM